MPTIGALSPLGTEPRFGADPKAATVPFASASQYPAPLGSGAMPMVVDSTGRLRPTWPQVSVMSLGGAHELTMMAAKDPPA